MMDVEHQETALFLLGLYRLRRTNGSLCIDTIRGQALENGIRQLQ